MQEMRRRGGGYAHKQHKNRTITAPLFRSFVPRSPGKSAAFCRFLPLLRGFLEFLFQFVRKFFQLRRAFVRLRDFLIKNME